MASPVDYVLGKIPNPQGAGRPLADGQIQEIASQLKDTDMSMSEIAKILGCTRISVSKINKMYNVRSCQNHERAVARMDMPGSREAV